MFAVFNAAIIPCVFFFFPGASPSTAVGGDVER